ncbi:GAF domain-containing protein [Novosphingobium sp.]|uniref:GAF domain-containing protein n=1 Tax=Novosphingobium sp. TaxID=1874826 RepID=UPI00260C6D36|nr:GAF domain-containing protein [Novosphingobium sp.]
MAERRIDARVWPPISAALAAVLVVAELRATVSVPAMALIALVFIALVWGFVHLVVVRAQLLGQLDVARIAANAIDQIIWIEAYPSGETAFATATYEQVWGHDALTLFQAAESRLDAVHADDRQRVRREIRAGQAGLETFRTEFRMKTASGDERVMHVKFHPHELKGKRTGYWIGFATDVTEERRYHASIVRNRRALRALALVNAAISRAQSRSELHKLVCQSLVEGDGYAAAWIGLREFGPIDKIRVTAHATTHADYIKALDIRPNDPVLGQGPTARAIREGEVSVSLSVAEDPELAPWREAALSRGFQAIAAFPLLHDGRAFGTLTLYSDEQGAFADDEIRILEEMSVSLAQGLVMIEAKNELLNSRKMELIGQISGELSHDFNNILGIIATHAEIGGREAESDAARDRFGLIAQAALRGVDITRSLLGIARHPRGIPEVADVNNLTLRLLSLIRAAVGPGVDVQAQLWDTPLAVEIDPAGFNNALVNLAINARDAMGEHGVLTLRTWLSDAPEGCPSREGLPANLRSAPLVIVEVADTGSGMSEDVREHAFEPFFSTKGPNKGTGLGLAAVLGFAVHHGGTARVLNSSPAGTTVQIVLPARAESMLAESRRPIALSAPKPAKLRVLIVDNEPDLLSGMVETLSLAGHVPTGFTTSHEALEALSRQKFDVLICDLLLDNGEDGTVLARQAAKSDPKMRVIVMSGNAARHAESDLAWPLLEKPFSVDTLIRQLQTAPAKTKAA